MMNPLIELFGSIFPLSEEDQTLIIEKTTVEILKKGEKYCERGIVCRKLGFVVEGVFKVVRINSKEEEYIQYFTNEGHFAVDVESFTNQTPSEESIEALTNCKVITISKNAYESFEKSIPNFPKIISQIKEKALLSKYILKSEMLVDDAQTKYNKLLMRQPNILQRIPQSQIASFLGITQYTLSRIRTKK